MTGEQAQAMLDRIEARWQMVGLDEYGRNRWLSFLAEQDASLAERAYETLTSQQAQPTIMDLRRLIVAATPVTPEAEVDEHGLPFKREMEPWEKGKIVALAKGDTRAWPEQKDGYDAAQLANPHYKTYVWPEQEMMPEGERLAYIKVGSKITGERLLAMITAAVGG